MDDQPNDRQRIAELEARLHQQDRKLAALESTLAEYEVLLDQLPIEIAVKDKTGRYLYLNGQSRRLYGFTEDGYQGKLPTEIYAAEDAKALHQHDMEVLRTGQISSQVARVPTDGEEQVFLAIKFPLRDLQTGTQKLGVAGIDITRDVKQLVVEQLTAEALGVELGGDFIAQALRESEARYRAVVEDQSEHICRMTSEGIVTFVNQACCDYMEETRERLVGRYRPFRQVTHPDDIDFVDKQQASLSPDHPSCAYQHRMMAPDGVVRWLHWTDHALFDEQGNLTEVQRVGRDVTAQVRAEQALRESEHKRLVDARMAALGQLIATVAHELRHPLGTISTSVSTLTRRLIVTEPADLRVLERIQRNVGRALNIIDELLTFSREGPINAHPIHVDNWLLPIIKEMQVTNDIQIEMDLNCPHTAAMDPARMHQALLNLVENSSHALRDSALENGPVRVRVGTALEAGRVRIYVADNGPGIVDDIREKIFEPLFTTKSFGIGLGLPLVKKVMDEHVGEVVIDAPTGEGTTVTLSFPAAANASETS